MNGEDAAVFITVGLLALFGGYTYGKVCRLERQVKALMRVIKRDQHTIETVAGRIKRLIGILDTENED